MQTLHELRAKAALPLHDACEGVVEPLLELVVAFEYSRHEEMHQAPQLHQIVLQRGASQQDPPAGVKPQKRLPPLGLPVLDHVRFVQNQVVPLLPPEHILVLKDEGVSGNAHVEAVKLGPTLPLLVALLGRAVVREDFECRAPLLEFHLPIQHHGRGNDDEVRAPVPVRARQMREKRNRLDRLPQPHLVC